jgi:hypothetical protein
VTGSFEAMMSGEPVDLLKVRRIGPESVEHAEGSLSGFDKNVTDCPNRRQPEK